MKNLDSIANEILRGVDGCLACGFFASDGALLGKTPDEAGLLLSSFVEVVSQLFAPPTEQALSAWQGTDTPVAGLSELCLTMEHLYLAKRVGQGRCVVVLVVPLDASVGRCWARLRMFLPRLEAVLP